MDVCSSCSAYWSVGLFTENCLECGGAALVKDCPHCNGKCGAIWHREVAMSNSYKEAFYSGGCKWKLHEKKPTEHPACD